jgi:hypothetical protein
MTPITSVRIELLGDSHCSRWQRAHRNDGTQRAVGPCNTFSYRSFIPDTYKAYNSFVAETCGIIDGIQHQATDEEAAELAQYFRGKLNLAVSLACQAEQERRSGHWTSAEEYQRKWEEVMAEAKRLLPLVRKSGVPLLESENLKPPAPATTEAPKAKRRISEEGMKRIIAARSSVGD